MVKENNVYSKRLQIYQNVFNKSGNIIKNCNAQIWKKKDLLNKVLNSKKENAKLNLKLNKKLKRYPIWHILCTLIMLLVVFCVISPISVVLLPGYLAVHINLLSVFMFVLLGALSNLGIAYKKAKLRNRFYKSEIEKDMLEVEKMKLVREIIKLKEQVSKAKEIRQYSNKQMDKINCLFDEYESYIGLNKKQEDTTYLNTNNKELKNKLI